MDFFTAKVQALLTFLIMAAWIGLMVAWALGYESASAAVDGMKEVVMLAATFWLMRQRPGSEKPAPKPEPEAPPAS